MVCLVQIVFEEMANQSLMWYQISLMSHFGVIFLFFFYLYPGKVKHGQSYTKKNNSFQTNKQCLARTTNYLMSFCILWKLGLVCLLGFFKICLICPFWSCYHHPKQWWHVVPSTCIWWLVVYMVFFFIYLNKTPRNDISHEQCT